MKKVLALVLAVIMVCTMAMAVTVTGVTTATSSSSTTVNTRYKAVVPGEAIVLTRAELVLDGSNAVLNKDGTFAPEKNKVAITFEKGADLVVSQGWVKGTLTGGSTPDYYYVITTKANKSAVLDDTADIIISKVVVTKYGIDGNTTYNFAKKISGKVHYTFGTNASTGIKDVFDSDGNNLVGGWRTLDTTDAGEFFLVFNYGRTSDDTTLVADGKYNKTNVTADTVLYTVKKHATDPSKKDATFTVDFAEAVAATSTLKVGAKVIFSTVPNYKLNDKVNDNIYDAEAVVKTVIAGDTVIADGVAVDLVFNNAEEGTKLYMVKEDGSLQGIVAKFDDNGVLKASVVVTGPVIVSDKALTASASTSTGTTTNPGTGANDVVGVAAALAVVALVSGAAISLKK